MSGTGIIIPMNKSMQPGAGSVHVNRPLTNLSVAFMQRAEAFIADRVFPVVSSDHQGNLFYTFDRDYFMRRAMEKRPPGTESAGGGYEASTDNFWAPVYGLHHDIPDQNRANQDAAMDLDRQGMEFLSQQALLNKEVEWANAFFTTSVWGTDIAGVSGTPSSGQAKHWSDAASTPVEDIRLGCRTVQAATGQRPNTLVVGREVFDALVDHPDIVGRLDRGQTTGVARVTAQALAALLDLERVLVMDAVQATSTEGATPAFGFIGGKKALLCYVAPSPGLMTPSAGYTFTWTGYAGASALGSNIARFRMEHLKSTRLEIEQAFVQKRTSAVCGYFFNAIVA